MAQDPAVRRQAHGVLEGLFSGLGQHAQGQDAQAAPGLNLEWMVGQFDEFLQMPVDLARIFTTMAFELTDLVLKALEEAGIELVKSLTPV